MKILAFDIYGDYGHFRKFFTTSSPLTFSIIPPTACYGLIGAILGLSNEQNDYLNVLHARTVKLAVQLLRPVQKSMIGINNINTKMGFWPLRASNPRTQIRMEVLQEPGYRLFVHLTDEKLFRELRDKVRGHETVYTPCLGLSEMIADIQYYGEGEAIRMEQHEDACHVHTMIPANSINSRSLHIEPGLQLLKERMPVNMNTEREVSRYQFYLFDQAGTPVKLSTSNRYIFDYDGTRIVFCNEVEE